MKYYRLDNSVDAKEIGRHTIQLDFADKKSQDSCWSLVDEEFPNFKPDLRFDLEKGSKLTDVASSGVDVPGFMINERVKNIFEQCKLPEHRYYEATVTDHKGVVHPYYCLHIMPNDYSMIDFDKTILKNNGTYENIARTGFPEYGRNKECSRNTDKKSGRNEEI